MDLNIIEERLGVGRGTSRFLEQYLTDINEMRKFIKTDIKDFHSPSLLPNIYHLTDLVLLAIDNGEGIFVWGHDDIDGHTATTIMVKTLKYLNAKVGYHIADKKKDGYIISTDWLKKIKDNGYKTIITVDFGSSSAKNFKQCEEAGIQLLVTDHHEVLYPKGIQVNPRMPGSKYPEKDLAGVGVAMKVAQHLATNTLGISVSEFYELNEDFLILALFGSMADRVQLLDENRTIVRLGFKKFKRAKIPWVKALREYTKLNFNQVISRIIPLLASAKGKTGVEFYLCNDIEVANEYIMQFKKLQQQWQTGFSRNLPTVLKCAKVYPNLAISIIPNLSLEFLGSFANRLKDEFQRTAIVAAKNNGVWVAEMRGKNGVNLIKQLVVLKDRVIDFGGHPLACGLSFLEKDMMLIIDSIVNISESFNHIETKYAIFDLPIEEFDKSLKKLFPLPKNIKFQSKNCNIEQGLVNSRKVIWNVAPPDDGHYNIIYQIDENLNIYVKEVKCLQ